MLHLLPVRVGLECLMASETVQDAAVVVMLVMVRMLYAEHGCGSVVWCVEDSCQEFVCRVSDICVMCVRILKVYGDEMPNRLI